MTASERMTGSVIAAVLAIVVTTACRRPMPTELAEPARLWLSLLDVAGRVETEIDGPFIDFGTTDQDKYVRGGWESGWGDAHAAPGQGAWTDVTAPTAWVFVQPGVAPIREVQLRVRSSVPDQALSIILGTQFVGSSRLGTDWRVLTFPVSAAETVADVVELSFRENTKAVFAQVDWLALRTRPGLAPPASTPKVGTLELDQTGRRALLSPTPRHHAFYLVIPPAAMLAFELGSSASTRFRIWAEDDLGRKTELFDAGAGVGRWTSGRADLRALSGLAVKLVLETTGPCGATGWGDLRILTAAAPSPAVATPKGREPRNIILLTTDALRADSFRPYDAATPVLAPSFDRLAADSLTFINAYTNGNWTRPSVATLWTGLYPVHHGVVREQGGLPASVATLPELLTAAGFVCAVFAANPNFDRRQLGAWRGWETYRDYSDDEPVKKKEPEVAKRFDELRLPEAPALFGDAVTWIRARLARSERFFLHLHTMDVHAPLEVERRYSALYHPQEYAGVLGQVVENTDFARIRGRLLTVTDKDYDWIRALYRGKLTRYDEALGAFLTQLGSLGVLDDTLFVFTADHGEHHGDHGLIGHGTGVYEGLVRVPLVFRLPGRFQRGGRFAEPVEAVDLLPTLLDLAGLGGATERDGVSLVPTLEGRAPRPMPYAFTESDPIPVWRQWHSRSRAVRVDRFKLIVEVQDKPRVELYDVAADPKEAVNHAQDWPVTRRLCEILLAEASATPAKSERGPERVVRAIQRPAPTAAEQDPARLLQLKALGYVVPTDE